MDKNHDIPHLFKENKKNNVKERKHVYLHGWSGTASPPESRQQRADSR
jgi:hypothetical protein